MVFEALVIAWFAMQALSALTLLAGFYLQWSFAFWSGTVLCTTGACLLYAAWEIGRPRGGVGRVAARGIDRQFLLAILLGAAAVVLTLSVNRPHQDDTFYVPPAVYYTNHPSEPISTAFYALHGAGLDLAAGRLQYFELFQAAFASVFGLHFLDVYHVIFPALTAFLFFGCVYITVLLFAGQDKPAWSGMLLLLCATVLAGEAHRTFGNFSLNRIFQGKIAFLTLGLSAWTYFSLRYLSGKSTRDWMVLLLIAISMGAATTTAIILLPLLTAVLSLAYLVAFEQRHELLRRRWWIKNLVYGVTCVPLLLYGLAYYRFASQFMGFNKTINTVFADDFYGQLRYLVDGSYPVHPALLVLFSLLTILLSPHRLFFVAWVLGVAILFTNPLVAPLVMQYLAPEGVYSRLFYLYPLPLFIALGGTLLVARLRSEGLPRRMAPVILAVLVPLALLSPSSILREGNDARLELPGWKVRPAVEALSLELVSRVPPGPMIAPPVISNTLVLLSPDYPQVMLRWLDMVQLLYPANAEDEVLRRSKARNYLYSEDFELADEDAFIDLLDEEHAPRTVVLLRNARNTRRASELLAAHDYVSISVLYEMFEVYCRRC